MYLFPHVNFDFVQASRVVLDCLQIPGAHGALNHMVVHGVGARSSGMWRGGKKTKGWPNGLSFSCIVPTMFVI